jgi:hypothetical protein
MPARMGAMTCSRRGEKAGDGAGRWRWYVVAACPAGFVDEVFAAQFAQVVGALAGGVAGVPGHCVDFAGEVFDGETAGGWGEGEHRVEGGAGAGFVYVNAADAGGAEAGGYG